MVSLHFYKIFPVFYISNSPLWKPHKISKWNILTMPPTRPREIKSVQRDLLFPFLLLYYLFLYFHFVSFCSGTRKWELFFHFVSFSFLLFYLLIFSLFFYRAFTEHTQKEKENREARERVYRGKKRRELVAVCWPGGWEQTREAIFCCPPREGEEELAVLGENQMSFFAVFVTKEEKRKLWRFCCFPLFFCRKPWEEERFEMTFCSF